MFQWVDSREILTGNHRFSHDKCDFPVIFTVNQSIECWGSSSGTRTGILTIQVIPITEPVFQETTEGFEHCRLLVDHGIRTIICFLCSILLDGQFVKMGLSTKTYLAQPSCGFSLRFSETSVWGNFIHIHPFIVIEGMYKVFYFFARYQYLRFTLVGNTKLVAVMWNVDYTMASQGLPTNPYLWEGILLLVLFMAPENLLRVAEQWVLQVYTPIWLQ